MLAPVPGRRQPLEGFDPDYVDIVDYIVRCTHRIWEGKNLNLIRTHYSDDCVVRTLGGESHGVQSVIDGTMATLQGFPDRVLFADHVIWSGDQSAGFLSSHRITSHMTHLGDNELGRATNRRATVTTIADCAVRANRIYEEWLVRDNYYLLMQLGIDPERIAREQANRDAGDSPTRTFWRQEADRTRANAADWSGVAPEAKSSPSEFAQHLFGKGWNRRSLGLLQQYYSPVCEVQAPSGRRLFGTGEVVGFISSLLSALPDAVVSVQHVASVPFFDLGTDIAVRWSLAGTHTGPGLHGKATGLPVYLLAISHWRVIDNRISEEWMVFDELALLRQLRQSSKT
jgi:hypothetical protein